MYEKMYRKDLKDSVKITRNISTFKSDFKMISSFGGGSFTKGIYRMIDLCRDRITKIVEKESKEKR